jgi:hypothetical protein
MVHTRGPSNAALSSVHSDVAFADATVSSSAVAGLSTAAPASSPLATAPVSMLAGDASSTATPLVLSSTAATAPLSIPADDASSTATPLVVSSTAALASASTEGHPLSQFDQSPFPRAVADFEIHDLPDCVNHGKKQKGKHRFSSLVSFHAFLAGLSKPDGSPKLQNIKEVYTFPEFEETITMLSAAPISDVGVQHRWAMYLKNPKGQPSTKGNKLRAVRWWLLYSFLRKDLDISEAALTKVWVIGAVQFHKLNKTTEHKLSLKTMTGPVMFKFYYKLRVKMNEQLLELGQVFLPYITNGGQLSRESEVLAMKILATAIVLLNISPRFQSVLNLVSFRFTPDPNAGDISALMVDPDDWAQLRFVLFGGKGKDHHQLESTPLPTTLSQLLAVWDSYTSEHLSETKSRLLFSNKNKDNPVSDLADWVRDNVVENLGMNLEDTPNGVIHSLRNWSFSIYAARVKGEPSLVGGVANLAHSSLSVFDEVYAVQREALWQETVSTSYFREMNLTGPTSELPPLIPPPLPEVVSNPPAVSLFAYKYMTKVLFGEDFVGPDLADGGGGTSADVLFDDNEDSATQSSKAEAVSCCFKCPSCEEELRGHKQQLGLLRSILRVDQPLPTATITSNFLSSTSSSSSTSSGTGISTRTSNKRERDSNSTNGSSSSSGSRSTPKPRLDWTTTLVDFVCQRRGNPGNNFSFRSIASAAQQAGLIPLGEHHTTIKSYYNNIIKKSTSQFQVEDEDEDEDEDFEG